jgi:L-asparaginase
MARLYVAYTGGTIGMLQGPDGYAPAPGYLTRQLNEMPELHGAGFPEFTVAEYDPLLASSAIGPTEWVQIAEDIVQHYADFDGFVIIHGTDTLAYTASALAFQLAGLSKPVILTGSQIPLCEARSDASTNLINAFLMASEPSLGEVAIVFGRQVLRGCRATKVSCEALDGFSSPNFPPLGELGTHPKLEKSLWLRSTSLPLHLARRVTPATVGVFGFYPGVTADMLRRVLQPPMKGLVLRTYGSGSAPDRDVAVLKALTEATQRGVVVVAVSQCVHGAVDLDAYEANSVLAKAGVVSGLDMTTEAVLCKLDYLLSTGHTPSETRLLVAENVVGELTLPG